MIRYAALRISLLVVVGALLYLAGMRGMLLAGSAIIIAALVAYIFFPTERDHAAKKLENFRHKEESPREPDEDMAAEDRAVEEVYPSEDPGGEQRKPDPELDQPGITQGGDHLSSRPQHPGTQEESPHTEEHR